MASNSSTLGTISTAWKGRTGAPKYGVASLNGNGSATVFNIAHGLGGTPTSVYALPISEPATAKRTVTKDGTNIIITYATAPASGTGNVRFRWWGHRL
jgi:hypothetical protein